jgi:hypothetical protein
VHGRGGSQKPVALFRWVLEIWGEMIPMETPSGLHHVLARKGTYAPPDLRMYDALMSERDNWLKLLTGKLAPETADSTRHSRVVLRPWVVPQGGAGRGTHRT